MIASLELELQQLQRTPRYSEVAYRPTSALLCWVPGSFGLPSCLVVGCVLVEFLQKKESDRSPRRLRLNWIETVASSTQLFSSWQQAHKSTTPAPSTKANRLPLIGPQLYIAENMLGIRLAGNLNNLQRGKIQTKRERNLLLLTNFVASSNTSLYRAKLMISYSLLISA